MHRSLLRHVVGYGAPRAAYDADEDRPVVALLPPCLSSHENYDVTRSCRTTAWQDVSLRLFDLRQNAFHLFFAEGAQRLTLGVTERAVL